MAAIEGDGRALERDVAALEHRHDHPVESEALTVLRGEDAGDAVRVQRLDLGRHDDTATAAIDLDVSVPFVA